MWEHGAMINAEIESVGPVQTVTPRSSRNDKRARKLSNDGKAEVARERERRSFRSIAFF